jgi:hypothetical protein
MTDKSVDKSILDSNKSNGMITKIWGPHFWEVLHFVSFGYPLEPTEQHKKDYKDFFVSVRNVLPCKYCRESYSEFILQEDRTKLKDEDLKNRDSLTRWVYKLHERVNEKIGINYGVTYDDVYNKYENIRAQCMPANKSCNMPIHLKANAYKKAERKHMPIISVDIIEKIKKYAVKRGVEFGTDITKLLKIERDNGEWILRDELCYKIIKKMRLQGIPSVETDGEFKGLPTIYELKLISLLSTTICCKELNEIIEKINKEF